MKLYAQGLASLLNELRRNLPTDEASKLRSSPQAGPTDLPSSPEIRLNSTEFDCSANATSSAASPAGCSDASPEPSEPAGEKRKQYEPRIAHRVKRLSPAQLAAMELLVFGHSDPSVANHLGVHRQTVFNWRHHHPAFRAELARRRAQVWEAAADKFRAGLENAVDVLLKQVNDVYTPTSFRAARAMLSLAHKFEPADDPVDVEGVLTLEARKLKVQKYELHPSKSLVYEDEREEALEHLMKQAGEDFTVPDEDEGKAESPDASADESHSEPSEESSLPGCAQDEDAPDPVTEPS